MSEHKNVYPVRDSIAAKAWADKDKYAAMYQQSMDDPEGFWGEQANASTGLKPPAKSKTPRSPEITSISAGLKTANLTSRRTA